MKSLKMHLAVGILIFINFAFLYKYSIRFTDYGLYISLLISLAQLILYRFRKAIHIPLILKRIFCYGFLLGIAALVLISHYKIPVESLQVDRATVISSFLTELFKGNYPYFARSHMDNFPGPMPIYFLIAAPFYLIGELGILSALGYAIFILRLIKKTDYSENLNFVLFYLITSAYLIWEIITRSNVFSFTTILLLVLVAFLNLRKSSSTRFYILAIFTGLLLSTRSIYVMVYFVFFISSLTNREITFKNLSIFLSIAALTFLSSFLPFILFFKEEFFTMNPFIIQSSFLIPPYYTAAFIFISIGLAFLVRKRADKFFYSGLSLFSAILIYSLYHLVNFGYQKSYIDSNVDISYFIFCLPFLLMYLMESGNQKQHNIELLKS